MSISRIPYRWRVVALMFSLSVINYLDRQTLSVLAPTLRSELGFSTTQYSYIVTSFLVAYTVGYLFCGAVVDRIGVKLAIVVSLSVWSFAGLAHGLAGSWVGLAVCRFVLGLGESFNSPCAIKGLTEWVPKRERGLSIAIFSNGYVVGAILAPPLVSLVAIRFGWAYGFFITGFVGLAFLLFWTAFYDSPEAQRRLGSDERALILNERGTTAVRNATSISRVIRHPALIGFFLARLFTDSLSYFFSFWLPEYLQSSRGFSLAMIGLYAWIPFLAADVGGPGGGALSDWLVRRGWSSIAARRRLMLLAACLMPCSLLAVHASSPYVALGFIAVLLAAQSCWMANIQTLMSEIFPREQLATFVAYCSVGGSIGGIVSTLLAGKIIERAGYVPVFTVLGFLHLTGYGLIHIFSKRAAARAQPT